MCIGIEPLLFGTAATSTAAATTGLIGAAGAFSAGQAFLVGSTALSAINQINQGNQQKKYYDYQAAQSEADAQAARELGEVQAEKIRKAGAGQQSEARAALAASGVEVTAGTPLKIYQEIDRRAEDDAHQAILSGGRQGNRYVSEARGSRMAGEVARSSGYGRASSVLSSGANYYAEKWRRRVRPEQDPTPVEDRNPPGAVGIW